jgi:NAD(P)-dependent dehydrogenase (short-subunit alcohol dehydrogenase family)
MDRFESLAAFVAVADRRGFAAASRALETSPPAITRAVAALERHLGVTLFHRSTRAVSLTDEGAAEAARQMPEGGRIIVIGSVNGDRMPVPGMASYALSKSALQGMARGLARDFGPRGITINVVQPGPIDTDANPEDGPMKDLMHSFMAIKRHGRPEEVAGMVALARRTGGRLRHRSHAHHRWRVRGVRRLLRRN